MEGFNNGGQTPAFGNERTLDQMIKEEKAIVIQSSNQALRVISYLLPNGNYDVYFDRLLIESNVRPFQLGFLKAFFQYNSIEETFEV